MSKMTLTLLNTLLITILAICVIFIHFNQIPAHLTWDEVEFARLAVLLGNQGYTPYSEYATGHASMYFYLILASFKLFGLNEIALRLPSALFGVLTSVALYGVLRRIWTQYRLKHPYPRHAEKLWD
jgi:4-amino-4-deoxy-L-arabinose transferase-like glycosyltransferase